MHTTSEELRRWLEEGATGDRDRMVEHLAACDVCGARYAEMIRMRPVEAPPQRFRPADFTARGARAFQTPSWRWKLLPAWARAAAAALIVAAAGVGYFVAGPAPDTGSTYRGAAAGVELVRPLDDRVPAAALVFEWRASAEFGPFRLRVIDLAAPDAPVIDREDVRSGYKPAAEERQRLRPGITYRWFLEFRAPSGGVDTSPAGRFEIQ